jgi:hypothetical protein
VRQKLGIRAGSRVKFKLIGDRAELQVVDTPVAVRKSGAGMLKHKGPAVPVDFDVASLLTKKR